jgi:hypothetical protein
MSRTMGWRVEFEHRSGNKISVRNPTQAEARAIYDNAELGPNDVKVSLIREESCVEAYKPIAPALAQVAIESTADHDPACSCDICHQIRLTEAVSLEKGRCEYCLYILPNHAPNCFCEVQAQPNPESTEERLKKRLSAEAINIAALLEVIDTLKADLSSTLRASLPSELDKLAHSLAFENAVTIIDSESIHAPSEDWRVVDVEGEVDLVDALRYLDLRGLLERHPEHKEWIRVIDESEATA